MTLAQTIAEELRTIDDLTWTAVNGFAHLHPSRRWPALLSAKHGLPLSDR
jgi:hypothetical protein